MSAGSSGLEREEALGLIGNLLAGIPAETRSGKGGRIVITLKPGDLTAAALKLRDDERLSFKYLSFTTGVDHEDWMEAIYIIRSVHHGVPVELRVRLDRGQPAVPTVSNIWSTANWHERETYDLLGIDFDGHPDLRRILTSGEDGVFPLRKDARPHRLTRDEWRFDGVAAPARLPGEDDRTERS